jgi:hypothetical protein
MPDHLHTLWAGLSLNSDQDKAGSFFRKYLALQLRAHNYGLQRQAWDVVLGEKERERDAVLKEVFYITENPVRQSIVPNAMDWPFTGSQAAGYPDLDWRRRDFETAIWTIYEREVDRFQQQIGNGEPSRSASEPEAAPLRSRDRSGTASRSEIALPPTRP